METTVVIQGVVDNVIVGSTKTGTPVWKYQIASFSEDKTKRLGDVRSYEDKGLKVGQSVVLMCFQQSRIYKDKIFTDTNLFKRDREVAKQAEFEKLFGSQRPGNGGKEIKV
jgi:hypothetical protein